MLGNPAYPTYQVFLAIFISAVIAGLIMPLWIRFLKKDGIGQQIRADGPQSHLVKAGTPTMGGVIILLAVVLTCFIMAKPTIDLMLAVGAMLATGALGLFDDVTKVGAETLPWPHARGQDDRSYADRLRLLRHRGELLRCGPGDIAFPAVFPSTWESSPRR